MALLAGGCAQTIETEEPRAEPAGIEQARDRYVRCVRAHAEKSATNPAGAEDIAVAAHASCWSDWDAYRQAVNSGYTRDARSREENQLGSDKADAHLRQFELETRRGVVQSIVERTLTKKP